MSRSETDTGYAPDRWEFDEEVSRVFDDMLSRSIPQYETMREAVTLVASAFLRRGLNVVDLGCSQGEALASLANLPAIGNRFLGLEVSDPMLAAAQARFADAGERVRIHRWDLRHGLPADEVAEESAGVVLSVLTLMFLPVNYRARLLAQVRRALAPGGALVLVEKVLGEGPTTDDVLTANYHAKKAQSGYTPDEIERKRLSLEGVLVPLTASWNEELLRRAGFSEVETFWAWMNFRGWVAVA